MAELTIDQAYGKAPAAPTAPAAPAAPKEISLDEAYGGKSPELSAPTPTPSTIGQDIKRGVGNIAAVADLVLGLPGQALSVGADVGGRIRAMAAGESRRGQAITGQAAASLVPESLQRPVQSIMQVLGFGPEYSGQDVEKVMGMIQSGIGKVGDIIESRSGGMLLKEDVESIANTLMMSAGARGTSAALQPRIEALGKVTTPLPSAPPKTPPSAAAAEDILNRYGSTGAPPGSPPPDPRYRSGGLWNLPDDATLNAEAVANKLMQEGASKAKVEAIVRKNPQVGKEMDKIRARREDVKTSRLGIVIQGEVLDPALDLRPKYDPQRLLEGPERTEAGTELAEGAVSAPQRKLLETSSAEERGRPGGAQLFGGLHPEMFRGADPKFLAKVAATTWGALLAGKMATEDKLEAAIAGGLAGLALTQLPRYINYVKTDWKNALRDTAGVATVTGLGVTLDKKHPIEGALIGMLWGTAKALPKAVVPKIGNMTIDDLINLRNGSIAAREREVTNLSWAIKTAVPLEERRVAVALAVDRGDLRGLSADEMKAARAYQEFTKSWGEAAKDAGVLADVIENYVTHIVDRKGLPASRVQEILRAVFGEPPTGGAGGAATTSPFARARKYATFEDLQKALQDTGLEIKTMDLAEITEIYGRSMGRAIENKRMITALQKATEQTAAEGAKSASPFIAEAGKAPPGYVAINSPQMRGKYVHPDLAEPLQFVLEGKGHNALVNGATALALAQKRIAVGLSLFHASNLINAFAGASGLKTFQMKGAIDAALEAYRKGGAGDSIDTLIRNGLKVERPLEVDQAALAKIGEMVDFGIEKGTGLKTKLGEKAFGAAEKVQTEVFDAITWDYLHTGMKLALAMREFERLSLKHPEMKPAEVARQVASFTNDTFGGLDWYRVATETQSQLGRRVGLAALSPKGRVALQIAMFAPDWTLSTFRAMYRALPGATDMPLSKGLAQGYVMRTALIYATLMNGINMATSGHPIWENKDPLRIEFRDGTSMQMAKHAMEGPEWLLNPRKTALNKLGFLVSEPANILLGSEYLTPERKIPMTESPTAHALKRAAPIAISSAISPDLDPSVAAARAVSGAMGFPIYGETAEQKERRLERQKEERRKKKEKEAQ